MLPPYKGYGSGGYTEDVSIHSRPIRRLTPQPTDRGRTDCPSLKGGVTEKDFIGFAGLSTAPFPLMGRSQTTKEFLMNFQVHIRQRRGERFAPLCPFRPSIRRSLESSCWLSCRKPAGHLAGIVTRITLPLGGRSTLIYRKNALFGSKPCLLKFLPVIRASSSRALGKKI